MVAPFDAGAALLAPEAAILVPEKAREKLIPAAQGPGDLSWVLASVGAVRVPSRSKLN